MTCASTPGSSIPILRSSSGAKNESAPQSLDAKIRAFWRLVSRSLPEL
jgi:hypothetical protein